MMDDNIFDEDDALDDYILYEETKKDKHPQPKGGGCLPLILFIVGSTVVISSALTVSCSNCF